MNTSAKTQKGFTLIELLVVIGIIAILAAIVIIAINPARQFAQARNSQRQGNVQTILDAIGQNMADHKGVFTCPGVTIPTSDGATAEIAKTSGDVDLRSCLVTTYMSEIPSDPTSGSNTCSDSTCSSGTYDTGYHVWMDSSSRYHVSAPTAAQASELNQTIAVVR